MFDPKLPHVVFANVIVMEKKVSAKGTNCVMIGWMGGQKMLFGEVYGQVTQGDVVTIRANIDGDFFRNYQVGDAPPKTRTRAGAGA